MSIGLFTDKSQQPTDAEIAEAIGARLPIWQQLIDFIRDNYPVQQDFNFLYGKNYGCAWRFRIRDRLLTSLYPGSGGFTAQVILSPQAIEQARGLKLGNNVQQAIARAKPYPEGRWLFIPVDTEQDLEDIRQLLTLRAATT
jgi:hypothetical protein